MDKDARAALLTAKSHVPVAVQRSSIPEGYADGGSISDDADGEDDDPGHDTDDIGFYSKAADAAAALPQASGTPAQMFGMLTGTGGKPWQGVKPEEMEWSGVKEAFKDHPTVTRDQLVQHFKQHSPQLKETKFALKDKPKLYEDGYETSYYHGPHAPVGEELMTPGGTNYREVVVHTPVLPNQATQRDRDLGYRQGRTEDDFVTPVSRQTHPVDAFEGAHHTIPKRVKNLLILNLKNVRSCWGMSSKILHVNNND